MFISVEFYDMLGTLLKLRVIDGARYMVMQFQYPFSMESLRTMDEV